MKLATALRRFLIPAPLVSLYAYARFGCKISARAEVELSPCLRIGRGAQISSFVKIKSGYGPLEIGERVSVATGCFIASHTGGVRIGDDTMLGPNVVVVGVNYRYDRLDVPIQQQGDVSRGITIGRDVWLGANVVVTDGAEIGDHSIVSPGSVVTGKLPGSVIASGNPAKVIFRRR